MKDFLIKWFINIIALFAVVHTIAGVSVDKWQTTIAAALVIGLLNAFLKPFFIMLTLPLNVLSLGFFTLFINGFIFYLTARFVEGFKVAGFWSAFWAALLFSIISFLLNLLIGQKNNIRFHWHKEDGYRRQGSENVIDVEGKVEEKR